MLQWLRYLPEAGSVLRGDITRECEEIDAIQALRSEIRARTRTLRALRTKTERAVQRSWTATEIAAAKARIR